MYEAVTIRFQLKLLCEKFVIFTVVLLFNAGMTHAQPAEDLKIRENCIEITKDATQALNMKDWPSLERIGRSMISRCKSVSRSFDESGHEHLATALVAQRRYKEARQAISDCLSLFYRSTHCRFELALVERRMKNIEACSAVRVELIAIAIDEIAQLEQERDRLQRKDRKSELENVNIVLIDSQIESEQAKMNIKCSE